MHRAARLHSHRRAALGGLRDPRGVIPIVSMRGEAQRDTLEELFVAHRDRGDVEALERVIELTAPRLLQQARRWQPRGPGAHELVQATFVSAIQSAHRYQPDHALLPWLTGILEHLAKKTLRAASRLPDPARLATPAADDPVAAALQREQRDLLLRVVGDMPGSLRAVMHLHVSRGLAPNEIAAELGRPAATVRSQLARGLEWLRQRCPRGLAPSLLVGLLLRDAAAQANAAGTDERASGPSHVEALRRRRPLRRVGAAAGVAAMAAGGLVLWAVTVESTAAAATPAGSESADGGTVASEARPAAERAVVSRRPAFDLAPGRGALRAVVRWDDTGDVAVDLPVRVVSSAQAMPPDLRSATTEWPVTRTDSQGAVQVVDVEPGTVCLAYGGGEQRSTAFSVRAGQAATVSLSAHRYARIRGRVEDGAGQAVPGAAICATTDDGATLPACVATVADADGHFVVDTLHVASTVYARAPGRAVSRWWRPNGRYSEVTARLVLDQPGHRVQGRVFDAEGRVVRGALVAAFAPAGVEEGAPVVHARTDEHGAYLLEGLRAEHGFVVAAADGMAPARERLSLVVGNTACVDLSLALGATFVGAVVGDARGETIDLSIAVGPEDAADLANQWGALGRVVPVARNGTFTIGDLPAGAAWAALRRTANGVVIELDRTSWIAVAGETVTWAPKVRPLRTVVGTVVDAQGRGLPNLRVGAVPRYLLWRRVKYAERVARTGQGGVFEMVGLERSQYRFAVDVWRSDGGPGEIPLCVRDVLVDSDRVTLVVSEPCEPSATIRGRLVDQAGSPVGGAGIQLALFATDRVLGRVSAVSDGTFLIGRLLPRTYWIFVEHGHGRLHLGARTLVADQALDLGDVVLRPPGTLRLAVRRSDGLAAKTSGAEVWVRLPRDGDRIVCPVSDRATPLVPPPLQPGDYELRLWGANHAPCAVPFRVRAGEQTNLDVVVQPATECRVRVGPLRLAPDRISQLAGDDGLRIDIFDHAGRTVVMDLCEWKPSLGRELGYGLPPGAYRVEVHTMCEVHAADFVVPPGDRPFLDVVLTSRRAN